MLGFTKADVAAYNEKAALLEEEATRLYPNIRWRVERLPIYKSPNRLGTIRPLYDNIFLLSATVTVNGRELNSRYDLGFELVEDLRPPIFAVVAAQLATYTHDAILGQTRPPDPKESLAPHYERMRRLP